MVYVNGELVPEDEAALSTFDHGVVVGDGAFETVLLRSGRPFALRRHLARLNRSLEGLGIECTDPMVVSDAVEKVISYLDYLDGRVRITVTAGPGPLGSGRYEGKPSIVVACAPVTDLHETSQVQTVPWPRNERGALVGLKTISYAENVVALAFANKRGSDEAIFANLVGDLCEGSGSNIFVVIDGELLTPPLHSGCLAGITRGLVLDFCGGVERDIPMSAFHPGEIEEAFLTSTIRGVQPISAIDGESILPGLISKSIAASFFALRDENPEP
jgi:branched-chain amino acid aminotransferase